MYCLPVGALLAVDEGRPHRALELYTLAKSFGHITNSRWFRQAACQELDNLHEALAPEAASVAELRGREMDLWQTAEDLLNELDSDKKQ